MAIFSLFPFFIFTFGGWMDGRMDGCDLVTGVRQEIVIVIRIGSREQ